MRSLGVFALLIFLATPAAASDAPAVQPAAHEDVLSVWDEITHQLHEWESRWREHFGGNRESGERPLISWMLSHRDELHLSSDQVRSLERLRNDFERDAIKNEADLRVAEMDLAEHLRADAVDLKKAEVKVREIERLHADLRLARIRAVEQGKRILSQEQRDRLRNLLGESRYSPRPE